MFKKLKKLFRRSKFETWQTVTTHHQTVTIHHQPILREVRVTRYFWHLRSSNGDILCSGESNGYVSAAGRDNGIAAVRRTAGTARLVRL